ncbi:MAG: T9SS type A sorting domain-containing protein, partial [candidate division WOR-3 bacterium]|nr:T9SS type A sorting domain-containing protein [candidate division WOR-3 bacterium]
WRDPDPLNKGETRNYLVCRWLSGDDFHHVSDTVKAYRPYPCPVLYTFTGNSFKLDNSLLPESEFTHQFTRDYYILEKKPEVKDGKYQFKIIEGIDNTYIDLIKLRLIDHPKGKEIGVLPNGEATLLNPSILPIQAIDNKGKDWKDSLLTEGGGYYYGKKGDHLDVKFDQEGDYLYLLKPPPKEEVEVSSESEGSTMLYTRMNGSNILFPYSGSVIRFLPQDSLCQIDCVRKAIRLPASQLIEKEASPVDLPEEVAKEDSVYYHLSPGDTLEFSFKAPSSKPHLTRSYCLEVVGYYTSVREKKSTEEGKRRKITYKNYIKPPSSIITGNLLLEVSSNERKEVKVEVIDRIGRIVRSKKVELNRGKSWIDLGKLTSGIYFVMVSSERSKTYKVTVIR